MVSTQQRPRVRGQKRQILEGLERLKTRGTSWATTLEIAQEFGYSSAQSHLNTHINGLYDMGLIGRRESTRPGRSRYEFGLEV